MKMKKTLYTLNVENQYSKDTTDLTYPLLERYAKKMGAAFHVITERRFPHLNPACEKLQIFELGKQAENDWNVYIDCDALIHPDMMDVTVHLQKDTVAHFSADFASMRWKYDEYFMRDGRNIGSCNWFTVASDLCLDLWHPMTDQTEAQAADHIFPIEAEMRSGHVSTRLMDDYILSRNIARFGLKFTTIKPILESRGMQGGDFCVHFYAMPAEEKVVRLKQVLQRWGFRP